MLSELRVAGLPKSARARSGCRSFSAGKLFIMWYVYFLELSNGHLYVGFSNNIESRVSDHRNKKVPSTSRFLPVRLKGYVAVETKLLAFSLERYFKSGSGKAILKKRFIGSSD